MSDSDLSFTRQRRDLFVISALLIVGQLAQFKIDGKLSLLGATIDVGNPGMLVHSAWALWLYWLVRYFQVYKKEAGPHKVSVSLRNCFDRETRKRAAILLARENPKDSVSVIETHHAEWRITWCIDSNSPVAPPRKTFALPTDEKLYVTIYAILSYVLLETAFSEYRFPFYFSGVPLLVKFSMLLSL